jgi:hypothetical protein
VQSLRVTLFDGVRAHPAPFALSGDPQLGHALSDQRPDNPFPEDGSSADVEAWRQHVIDVLRGRAGYDTAVGKVPAQTVMSEQVGSVAEP